MTDEIDPEQSTSGLRRSELRVGVVAGVIASVLVMIFVQPLLGWVWGATSRVLTFVASGLVDSVYRSAALGHRNYLGVFLLVVVTAALVGAVAGALAALFWPPSDAGPSRSHRRLLFGIGALLLVLMVVVTSMVSAELQYHTSFQQRLTVLAPAIDSQLEEELRSEWAQMRNRADFLSVTSRMGAVADSLDVDLPAQLLN